MRVETKKEEQEKLADQTAEKVVELLGLTSPVRQIRKSQVLSLILGAAGFALFSVGIGKLFENLSGWLLLVIGFLMMATTGALLKNLSR